MKRILLFLLLMPAIVMASKNQADERPTGYTYLDDGKILHFWNEKDDYYLNTTSGIQLTNHYQEYWTHNYFCLAYKNLIGNWQAFCNDALPFQERLITDNSTFINITYGREIITLSNSLHVNLTYHLKRNDSNLTLDFMVKNIGIFDFDRPTAFVWDVRDIRMPSGYQDDFAWINYTHLNLSQDTGYFTDVQDKFYKLYDDKTGKYLTISWKNDDYNVSVYDGNSINKQIAISSNIGIILAGQQKVLQYSWIDAGEQFARPDRDNAGSWSEFPSGGIITIWDKVDETVANDATDYGFSPDNPVANEFLFGLSNVIDPEVSNGHTMRWRARYQPVITLHSIQIDVALLEGTTVIATKTQALTTSWVSDSLTLSTAQADSITNYNNLQIRIIADYTDAGFPSTAINAQVTWAELEVPSSPLALGRLNLRNDGILYVQNDGIIRLR